MRNVVSNCASSSMLSKEPVPADSILFVFDLLHGNSARPRLLIKGRLLQFRSCRLGGPQVTFFLQLISLLWLQKPGTSLALLNLHPDGGRHKGAHGFFPEISDDGLGFVDSLCLNNRGCRLLLCPLLCFLWPAVRISLRSSLRKPFVEYLLWNRRWCVSRHRNSLDVVGHIAVAARCVVGIPPPLSQYAVTPLPFPWWAAPKLWCFVA